jgi:hypothetical protein
MDVKSHPLLVVLVKLEFQWQHSPRLQGFLNTVEQHT